jgi:hypothetical protein
MRSAHRRLARWTLVTTAAVVLVGLAGCSSADESDPTVQPIEPILATDIEIVPDGSGTTATLTVETSIPVACSVVYGTSDSFGLIAVDNDMQGGAHQDHGPLLTGLTPDTEYQYRLQGTDAAGTLYRSEVMTFRTPAATDNELGTNVAPAGTVAGFSSEFSDTFAAGLAFDGDLGTEWSTAGDGDDAWVEIDLGADTPVAAAVYRTRQMADGSAITDTFTMTIDGTVLGPFPTGREPVLLDAPVTGRSVRFDAETTTGGNTGAVEIEIYATG